MVNPIAVFKNEKFGISSYVYEGDRGYSVSLLDDDSGQMLPTIAVGIKDQAAAITKAKMWANVRD